MGVLFGALITSKTVSADTSLIDGEIYRIASALNPTYVLTVGDDSPYAGANITLETMSKSDEYQDFVARKNSDGTWSFLSYGSGLALDLRNGLSSAGTKVQTWTDNGTNAQKWSLYKFTDGTYSLTTALQEERVIDVQEWSGPERKRHSGMVQ